MLDQDYIIVKEAKETELLTALKNLANLYAGTGFTEQMKLYKHKRKGFYLLLFTNNPDFDRFQYFVNYLWLPEGVNIAPPVRGYWTVSEQDKVFSDEVGKRIMLYISEIDPEFDEVQVVTESNKTFKSDFGGRVTPVDKTEKEFQELELSLADFNHTSTISPDPEKVEEAKSQKQGKGCMLVGLLFLVSTSLLAFMTY